MPTISDIWPYQSPSTPVAGRMSTGWARMQGGLCQPQAWEIQYAEWTLGDVTDYTNVSNGSLNWFNFYDPITTSSMLTTFPAGQYLVKYCVGAWLDAPGVWAVAKEDPAQPQLNGGNRITCRYFSASVLTQAHIGEQDAVYSSYAVACGGALNSTTPLFNHSGGNIQMGFIDLGTVDNGNAPVSISVSTYTNPRYMLVGIRPWFTTGPCYALYTQGSSPRWTGTFTVNNITPYEWDGIQIKMQTSSVVTNPQSPITVNFAPNEAKTFTLTFDSPGKCDPVLEVWYGGAVWQSFQTHLSPVIHWDRDNLYQGDDGCGNSIFAIFQWSNLGNMDTTPQCSFQVIAMNNFLTNPKIVSAGCVAQDFVTMSLCQNIIFVGCSSVKEQDFSYTFVTPKPTGKFHCIVTDGGTTLLDQVGNSA